MYCPDGYSTIHFLYDYAFDERLERGLNLQRAMVEAARENSEEEAARHFFRISPADMAEFDMFQAIGADLYVASPLNQVVKLDMRAIRSGIDFWEFTVADLERVVRDHPEVGEEPPDFRHNFSLFSYPTADFQAEFKNPKVNRGSEDLWDFAKEMNMERQHQVIPLFFERRGYTISFQAFDYLDRYNFCELDQWRDVIRILRPFEGWAMCVKKNYAESGRWQKWIMDPGDQGSGQDILPDESKEGQSQPVVAKRILQAFRDGRRLTRKACQLEYAPGKSDRWFEHAWRLARTEEPDLGKPGRRPATI